MKKLSLTKIGFFNPGRLSDEEIELCFITRIPFFKHLFEKIINESPGSIPQHFLVIGQRGMGKTSLLVRIAAELRKKPFSKTFIPLTFPEEQYNIDRLSKFWLNCLDAFADALDRDNNNQELTLLDERIKALAKNRDNTAANIYDEFKKWALKIKKRPVLLVDNLNLIFEKLSKDEQHQLRAILMCVDAPIMVGASAITIQDTINYGAPFYDAFQISYLKKLSFEESFEVLLSLARITETENFENNIYQHRARLQALYQLTGGTPRILALLFPLLRDGFSENVQIDLDALLDVITPLYKASFEELAPQLQVVLDAVALNWDPINLEQLRLITQLDNAQLSPQLKRLIEVGWLKKIDAYKAKGNAYEISERFFNIWYLMRRSSRRQKKELYCLTRFLETFYGKDIQKIAKERLTVKSENVNQVAFDLALADGVRDVETSRRLKEKSYDSLFEMSKQDEHVLKHFSIPADITKQKINELGEEFTDLIDKKKYIDALNIIKKIINIDEKSAKAWNILGSLYAEKLGKYAEAEVAYKKAISVDEKYAYAWNGLGNLYAGKLGKYAEAEEAYRKAISLEPSEVFYKYNLVFLLRDKLNKIKEAKELFGSIIFNKTLEDSHYLNQSLFAFYDGNTGIATELLQKAIETIKNEKLPNETIDDWYRALSVIIKLGFGNVLLQILTKNNWELIMRPFYIAIEAIIKKDEELFLNSVAAEVREPARAIMEQMIRFMK